MPGIHQPPQLHPRQVAWPMPGPLSALPLGSWVPPGGRGCFKNPQALYLQDLPSLQLVCFPVLHCRSALTIVSKNLEARKDPAQQSMVLTGLAERLLDDSAVGNAGKENAIEDPGGQSTCATGIKPPGSSPRSSQRTKAISCGASFVLPSKSPLSRMGRADQVSLLNQQ